MVLTDGIVSCCNDSVFVLRTPTRTWKRQWSLSLKNDVTGHKFLERLRSCPEAFGHFLVGRFQIHKS